MPYDAYTRYLNDIRRDRDNTHRIASLKEAIVTSQKRMRETATSLAAIEGRSDFGPEDAFDADYLKELRVYDVHHDLIQSAKDEIEVRAMFYDALLPYRREVEARIARAKRRLKNARTFSQERDDAYSGPARISVDLHRLERLLDVVDDRRCPPKREVY